MLKILGAKNNFKYLVPALLVLALILRLPLLNNSFWLDEASQALESARPFSEQLDIVPDFQPPLLHYLLHFAMRIGRSEWWLRLVGALIPGLITIYTVYLIGCEFKYKKAGLISAFLLAISSFHIFYSQEIRPYSLAAMWGMLSWLFLIQAWKETKKQPFFQSNWTNYLLATILGLYSMYLYPFLAISQFLVTIYYFKYAQTLIPDKQSHLQKIWSLIINSLAVKPIKNFLIGKDRASLKIRRHVLALAIAIVVFLPWLPTFLQQLSVGQSWRQEMPGWESVVSSPQLRAPFLTWGKFVFGIIDLQISPLFISLSLLVFALTAFLLWKLAKQSRSWLQDWLLVTLMSCLPFLLSWIVSFWVPVVRPKRLLFVQAAMYLSVGMIVASALKNKQKLLNYLAGLLLTLLIAFNSYSTYLYYTQPRYQREDWRGLQQLISARFPDRETLVVMSFNNVFAPWRWYNQGQFATLTTEALYIENVDDLKQQLKPIYNYDFVLVFDYLRDITDPQDKLLETVESYGFKQIDLLDVPNIGFVRVYLKDRQQITG